MWAARILIVVAVCIAYANTLHGPFIFDDAPSIAENRSIRHLAFPQVLEAPPEAVTTCGRPLVNLSLAINFAMGGLAVEGYHLANLALHILAALVLFALVRRTLVLPTMFERFGPAATGLALAMALLWACHPLQTESVTYIVQRAEVIVGLFYFLTLYCFLRGATVARGRVWHAAAVGACVLGVASKEVIASAPLITLLYDRTFVVGSFRQSLRRRWPLWLALAATWVLLAFMYHLSRNRGASAGFGLGMTAWQYARTQFACIIHYLRLAFWPSPLVLDYGARIASEAAEIVPHALAVFVLLVATAAGLVLRPKWGFLGAWFFAILAPSSSIVPLATQTEAEHRMYLPLVAVAAIAVFPIHQAVVRLRLRSRWAGAALLLAATSALGWRTHQRNEDYQSELAIWDANIRDCPLSARAYLTRGSVYWTMGRYDDAIKDYDQCIALSPRDAKAFIGRGNAYSDRGQPDEALRAYNEALRLNPNFADAYCGRGSLLVGQGQIDSALRDFRKAIELDPEFSQAYFNRANAYEAKGELDAAISDYDEVIRLQPNHAQAYASRGRAWDSKGHIDAAISDYDRAIRLRPDLAEAYSNRCSARDVKGQLDAAVRDCDTAIELRPNFAEAYSNRANALQGKGQYGEAIKDYDRAIELKPDFLAAYQNRAMAHLHAEAYDKAWADLAAIRKLGGTPIPSFVTDLMKKSGRSE